MLGVVILSFFAMFLSPFQGACELFVVVDALPYAAFHFYRLYKLVAHAQVVLEEVRVDH